MQDVFEFLQELEKRREEFSREIRESGIIKEFKKKQVSGVVSGVDGSILTEHFHNFSIYLVRALACTMEIKENRLISCRYVPDIWVDPKPILIPDLEKDEQIQMGSILRMEAEWGRVEEVLDDSDWVLVDGSLLPHPGDSPRSDSVLKERYENLVKKINRIIQESVTKNIPVIGVVKDSTSTLLSQKFGKHFRDTSVLDMNVGEYTEPVPFGKGLMVTYLQTSEYDFPLRIEFPEKFDTEEIVNLIFQLSNIYLEFSYPNVLMEADLRVRMDRSLLDKYLSRIPFEKKRRMKKVF